MSEGVNVEADFAFLGICLLIIMFWGEPDLVDALINFLMRGCGI